MTDGNFQRCSKDLTTPGNYSTGETTEMITRFFENVKTTLLIRDDTQFQKVGLVSKNGTSFFTAYVM